MRVAVAAEPGIGRRGRAHLAEAKCLLDFLVADALPDAAVDDREIQGFVSGLAYRADAAPSKSSAITVARLLADSALA